MEAAASSRRRVRARLRRGLRAVTVRPRLLSGAGFAAVLGLALPSMAPSTRAILCWNGGVFLYMVLAVVMMATSTDAKRQRRADREDVGAAVVLAIAVAAAIASLVAIGFELRGLHDAAGRSDTGVRLGLVGATILQSWIFVHLMFALHYAHEYYAGEQDRSGLAFPGGQPPDYWDFLYFSFTIAVAAQTADVAIASRAVRRIVLSQAVLAFFFNASILALTINISAALLAP